MRLQDDNWCFACGKENPIGLRLEFYEEENAFCCEFTPGKNFQGYEGIMHGGIASVILDEIMARFLIDIKKIPVVTSRMEVRFRKPVRINSTVMAKALYDHSEKNFHFVTGELRSKEGILLVSAKGIFAQIS